MATVERQAASILLVEDDDLVRELVEAQLAALGHRVRGVEDASAALGAIDAGLSFDLLVTDVTLPGEMDGYALARLVRQGRPGLPVLYASGHATSARDAAVPGAGATRHLQKPFRVQQLARAVDELLATVPEPTR